MSGTIEIAPATIGRHREAALFAVALAAAIAGVIPLFRLGFDLELAPIAVAWCLFAAAALVPLFLLDRLSWFAHRPNSHLLTGPLTVLVLLTALAASFLGFAGLAIIVLAALVGLADAIRQSLSGATMGRCWLWLLAGALCFLPLLGALTGVKYTNFLADQLALYGRADGDTLFHAAIINSLRYFGVPATGIDGVRPFGYHVGAHFLVSRIAALSGADAIPSLIAARAVLLTPLLMLALMQGGIAYAAHRMAKPSVMAAVLLALFLLLGLSTLGLGVGSITSESFVLATALLALVFVPAFLLATEASIEAPTSAVIRWVFCIAAIFVLAACKVSIGYVFAGTLGYWALRSFGLKSGRFWLIAVSIGIVSLGSLGLFSPSAGESGAEFLGTPFYVEYGFRNGYPLLPLTVNIEGLALIGLMILRHCRSSLSVTTALKQNRLLGLETFLIILLLANLPGLLLRIDGGDAGYFIQVFGWAALPMILGEMLVGRPWIPAPAAAPIRRWAAPTITLLIVAGCAVGTFGAAQSQANMSLAVMALVRTGDPTYFDSTKRKELRADARRALKELGWSGLFLAPPPKSPAADLVTALKDLRATYGNAARLYAPADALDYWSLTKDCDGKSLLSMAEAGVAMIDGYYPDQEACRQEFALSGYEGSAAPLTRPLSDEDICALSTEAGRTVLILGRGLEQAGFRIAACKP